VGPELVLGLINFSKLKKAVLQLIDAKINNDMREVIGNIQRIKGAAAPFINKKGGIQ